VIKKVAAMVTVGFFDVAGSNASPYVPPVRPDGSPLPAWPIPWADRKNCPAQAGLALQCRVDDPDPACRGVAQSFATTGEATCVLDASVHSPLPRDALAHVPSCSAALELRYGGETLYQRPFLENERPAALGAFRPFGAQ
jgi:hypothetical protein